MSGKHTGQRPENQPENPRPGNPRPGNPQPGNPQPGVLSDAADEQLARVVDELAERLCEGERLDWPTCLKAHPGEADALKELAPAIEILVLFGKTGVNRT